MTYIVQSESENLGPVGFPMMQSILDGIYNRQEAETALERSRRARRHYIDGITNRVGDDELRHRHFDAMDAAAASTRATNRYYGQR